MDVSIIGDPNANVFRDVGGEAGEIFECLKNEEPESGMWLQEIKDLYIWRNTQYTKHESGRNTRILSMILE